MLLLQNKVYFTVISSGARSFFGTMRSGGSIQVSTWNIAAINNNPFEYWMSCPEKPEYEDLMISVEEFIENPGDKDVVVSDIFTNEMFEQLEELMLNKAGWKSIRHYWESDFKNRKIISGFMKDEVLGLKRLASMPDRITNTISTADGKIVCRPTVINMYEEDLSTLDVWWNHWKTFMFDTTLQIKNKDSIEELSPYAMLKPIPQKKYPAITEQEEEDSLPLQTMCAAIFDCILVHMMNTISTKPSIWQDLKRIMIEALNKKKVPNTMKILESTLYSDSDIITLQEVSLSFVEQARNAGVLNTTFHIITPEKIDGKRDQNSVIFLGRKMFPSIENLKDITQDVEDSFPTGEKVPVETGDILAILVTSSTGIEYVIASFHGDTNGLATKPVLDAIMKAKKKVAPYGHLIFGLDANTYETQSSKTQHVLDFGSRYVSHSLTSCWGDIPQAGNYTTYNARTYLQTQLNKACKRIEKRTKGDVNPKDFILFQKKDYSVVKTWKDNTGDGEYIEDMAFPTLSFPSDHGILATILEPK